MRNVDVCLVASPESFIVPELSYFGQHCFAGQSLAVNWELFFFWYEGTSCAKEFDLFISV